MNSVYDPMYETLGLPIDPHLRMFLASQRGECSEIIALISILLIRNRTDLMIILYAILVCCYMMSKSHCY